MTESYTDTSIPLIKFLIDSIKNKKKINLVCYVDDPGCDKHHLIQDNHQESSLRTEIIRKGIIKYGLTNFIEKIGSISVRKSDLLLCHDKNYIEQLFTCARINKPIHIPEPSKEISMKNIDSLESILAAVASVYGAVDTVCGDCRVSNVTEFSKYKSNLIRKVFCNVRPPGHHAHHKKGGGFCFMNNVALGTIYAMKNFPQVIKKVLIFDWDLHHGDGTEDIFKNNQNVMYASFHRGGISMSDVFYPGTGVSEYNESENIINFPISLQESLDVNSYMNKFYNIFIPLANKFKPDLVMISAGFDSHKDDLYHALPLDYVHFHEMTKSLAKLADEHADGRLISVLEGGYTFNVLAKSVVVHIATMINGYK